MLVRTGLGWLLYRLDNSNMKPSLLKLQKFLKLEAERGYDNHAVVGGLERMLEPWKAEALAEGVPEELVQLVSSRINDYGHLSSASREEVLEGLWRRIQQTEGSASPAELASPFRATPAKSISEKPGGAKLTPAKQVPIKGVSITKANDAPSSIEVKPNLPLEADETDEDDELPEENEQGSLPALGNQPPVDSAAAVEATISIEPSALDAPVTILPGIGPHHAQTLARLGIHNLRDMLYYLPRRYDDYSQMKPINRLWYGEEVTVIGTIQSVTARNLGGGRKQIIEVVVSDGTGALRCNWFNQPWIGKRLRPGVHIVLSGKIDQYLGRLVMNSPEWEPLEQQQLSTNRIVPVYPLTANITQRWLRKMINSVVAYWAPRIPDPLPPDLRKSSRLVQLSQALRQVHFPDSWESLKAARYRLSFDEIFLLQIGVLRQKRLWSEGAAQSFFVSDDWLGEQIDRLPFTLTSAQQRVLQDVRNDLVAGHPMNRLLQGDVGSGKTIVAALAIAMVAKKGAQTAVMAPTSILAEQHYRNLAKILADPDQDSPPLTAEQIRLLIGATPESEKIIIRQGLEDGSIKLVIGTHALIEDPVQFKDLELIIIDEQHRFGVEQRALLRSKGTSPHLLVMTATPIPRSLALTIYGDLDLSVIDEMPPGRQEISTYVLQPRERERAYRLIKSQVDAGHQAFIIYPLVEETEKTEAMAAVEEYQRLKEQIFTENRLGLLHGRLRQEEKEEVMALFRDQKYHILVSTSVVEVGVDIPNATVMLIEGANHFGLAQLHQFRGRVGRGSEKSYCILVPDTGDEAENERLKAMTETNDGFVLAERDLQQRGPGDFLGTRQSGFAELQLARLTDVKLIENARRQAQALFDMNASLTGIEYAALNSALDRFWGGIRKGDVS
jgi:ATP-dependent DNA helicase RecG